MFSKTENYSLIDPIYTQKNEKSKSEFVIDDTIKNLNLSIDQVKILNKMELVGKAEVLVAWVIADDTSDNPIQMGNTKIFEKLKKNDSLKFGPTGLSIYQNQNGKIPKYIRYSLLVIESDERVRKFGERLESIRSSQAFKTATKSIIATTALAAAPVAAVTAGVDLVLKLLAKGMSMNKDDQMILIEGSYNRLFDDLSKFKNVNAKSRYVDVNYSLEAK